MRVNLEDLNIFAHVAESQSFRAAATHLRMSRSSVSKRVGQLEKELGVALFNRSTRRISLTDAGETLYRHWQNIAVEIDGALAAVQGNDQLPTGTLRVSMPTSLGAALMPGIVQSFLKAWPDLKMSVVFSEHHVEVVGQGFDAVIRIAEKLADSRLTAKRLATTRQVLAASPQYLEQHGTPQQLKDLKQHKCLGLGYRSEHKMNWSFESAATSAEAILEPAFAANNDLALILSACLGGGILYLPRVSIESEIRLGLLQLITLEDCRGPRFGVFAVYPQAKPPAKVKVFVDFVRESLERLPNIDRWAPLRAPDS